MLEKNIPSVTQRGTQSERSSVEQFSFANGCRGTGEQAQRAEVLMQVETVLYWWAFSSHVNVWKGSWPG